MMKETFDTYTHRSTIYKILLWVVICFIVFVFTCIFFSDSLSKIEFQPFLVALFLVGLFVTLGSMVLLPALKTYKKDGVLIITESSISIYDQTYTLVELLSAEINAGDFKGRGGRGGFSDGSGNKITVTATDQTVIETKFVVNSKDQKENLTQIMKFWKAKGFKIISNGIDLM